MDSNNKNKFKTTILFHTVAYASENVSENIVTGFLGQVNHTIDMYAFTIIG